MKLSLLITAFAAASASATPLLKIQIEDDSKALFSGCRGREDEGGDSTISQRLKDDKNFSRFYDYLQQDKGLRDELDSEDTHSTVFAPCNEAFEDMERRVNYDGGKMRDVLRYHIAGDSDITEDCMHAGALIPSNLKLRSLGDRHQRIRVYKFSDHIWLNMHARVEKSIEASNGMIFAIDKVLQPPCQVTEQLFTIPTTFSTFGAALERTGLSSKVDNEKGLTVMAPSNKAWEMLGFDNLKYLFTCVGQEREDRGGRYEADDEREGRKPQCQGVKDLKKIVEFHVGKEVAYSTDFMKKKETTLKTLCGHEMTVCAKHQQQGDGESDEDNRRRKDRKDRKGRKDEGGEHRDVREYNFIVNDGEARIQFTDGLASNAAIHMVDNIMVPENVKLPYDRWSRA